MSAGRSRCAGCNRLVVNDRLDGWTILHWSTGREACGPQIRLAVRRWLR